LAGPSMGQYSQKPENINPCDPIAIEKVKMLAVEMLEKL
jgi:hypothetical protein